MDNYRQLNNFRHQGAVADDLKMYYAH